MHARTAEPNRLRFDPSIPRFGRANHHHAMVTAGGTAAAGGEEADGAVSRRTRAQQSLLNFSLEELEQLLELDAEDAAAEEDAAYENFIQVRH